MIIPSRTASTPDAINAHARTIMIESVPTSGDAHIKADSATKIIPLRSINHQPFIFAPPSHNDTPILDIPSMKSHNPITNGRTNDVIPGLAIINEPAMMSRTPNRMKRFNLKNQNPER